MTFVRVTSSMDDRSSFANWRRYRVGCWGVDLGQLAHRFRHIETRRQRTISYGLGHTWLMFFFVLGSMTAGFVCIVYLRSEFSVHLIYFSEIHGRCLYFEQAKQSSQLFQLILIFRFWSILVNITISHDGGVVQPL